MTMMKFLMQTLLASVFFLLLIVRPAEAGYCTHAVHGWETVYDSDGNATVINHDAHWTPEYGVWSDEKQDFIETLGMESCVADESVGLVNDDCSNLLRDDYGHY